MYQLNFSQVYPYLPGLLKGFAVTVELSMLSTVLCFVIVIVIYVFRFLIPHRYRLFAEVVIRIYIDVIQTLPVLVGLVWVYFGLPMLDVNISPSVATVLVLGVSFSAFALDLLMGAERAVTADQVHVGAIHGMSPWKIARWIYVPIMVRLTADPIVGQFITVIKLSTFASVIGTQEILSKANGIITTSYRPLEVYTLVALIFLITIAPMNLMRRAWSHRELRRGEIG